jgi:hypothetical protein
MKFRRREVHAICDTSEEDCVLHLSAGSRNTEE